MSKIDCFVYATGLILAASLTAFCNRGVLLSAIAEQGPQRDRLLREEYGPCPFAMPMWTRRYCDRYLKCRYVAYAVALPIVPYSRMHRSAHTL
eukprot:9502283-Pyramimonas_sp.AAC.1